MKKLYEIERVRLTHDEWADHYRYDIINQLTQGCVMSVFSKRAMPPVKLIERCTQLNEKWMMPTHAAMLQDKHA